ncbi:hypothetical protein [Caballeronia sp. dw_19]|uniref:hypothetical protein n=1 Tax=Caballeronia sp. dw_19 TaxID=2719791 RepID=UPI0021025F45|nr:hypothetical protein [Caballeronia sp. dw_19]
MPKHLVRVDFRTHEHFRLETRLDHRQMDVHALDCTRGITVNEGIDDVTMLVARAW